MVGQSLRAATSSVCACCGEPLAMAAQGMKAWRVGDHFVCNEFCADGISVHIVELLRHLRAGVDIEIVISALPEPPEFTAPLGEAKGQLPRALPFSGAQGTGDSLLETLDDLGGSGAAGLAQEQVHMFGHKDVANESKAVAQPRLFEGADGQVAGPGGVQKRPALITAEGDEMQIAKTGDASQIVRHGEKRGPPFPKPKG